MLTIDEEFKRGDTFRIPFRVSKADDTAQDITNWTITAKLKKLNSNLIQELTVTKSGDASGIGEISATASETALWPKGKAVLDVQVIDGFSETHTTESCSIVVTEGH